VAIEGGERHLQRAFQKILKHYGSDSSKGIYGAQQSAERPVHQISKVAVEYEIDQILKVAV
jgi:hypothetical protein